MYHNGVGSPAGRTRGNGTSSEPTRPNGDLVAITQTYLGLVRIHFSTQCISSVISYILSSDTFKHNISRILTLSILDTKLSLLK